MQDDKPKILQAIELILAKPENIKKEALNLYQKYYNKFSHKTDEEIKRKAAEKI